MVVFKTFNIEQLFQLHLPKWCQRFLKNVFKRPGFCQKAQNPVFLGLKDFIQISPACGSNTYQIMYGSTLDF